jgi:hypothetical protein
MRTVRLGLVLLGIAGLLTRRGYTGPFEDAVLSYGGNVSVAFALYFVVAASRIGDRAGPIAAAALSLLATEAFELGDGFGVMQNVYDRFDLVANAAGVGLAALVDGWLRGRHPAPSTRG